MLRQAKLALLGIADALGVNKLLLESPWRRQRLLILCYHGISIEDEHEWNPELYITPALLFERLTELKRKGMHVLPLSEAIERLKTGTLPPRSAAITFDDGNFDFYKQAWPILQQFQFPVTIYYTTYYSEFNKPVFDVALSYLAWKGNAGTAAPNLNKLKSKRLDARQKDDFLRDFATSLGINYENFCAKRLLQIMTPAEASELARQGVDFQLHTHRHRVSSTRERFLKEIDDNRLRLDKLNPRQATHFCYPGGYYRPEFPMWLADHKVVSATTCNPGIAGPQSPLHLLPRFIDTMYATPVEFRSWLSGLASFLPQRQHVMSEGQLMEEYERSNT